MKLESLRPGITVYAVVGLIQGGRTKVTKPRPLAIHIVKLDLVKRQVKASWNGLPARWFSEHAVTHWHRRQPLPRSRRLSGVIKF